MKSNCVILLFLTLITSPVISQINAITDTGQEVLLFPNGSWKSKDEIKKSWDIKLDTIIAHKSSDSNFLVKGNKINYGIWLNPKKWKFSKNETDNSPSEYNFVLIGQDAYAIIIAERIEIPLNTLKDIALKNAKKASPDAKIVSEDVRKINGLIVNCMEFEGTISGIKFSYFNYYYSGPAGSIQFISYTSNNLFDNYKKEFEILLNGLVILNN